MKLTVMVLLSAAYLGLSGLLRSLTGRNQLDGILGVVLGLYICSLPVRHFLDLLIYGHTEGTRFPSKWKLSWWLTLNTLVLLCGWLVIVVGATRFTAGTR